MKWTKIKMKNAKQLVIGQCGFGTVGKGLLHIVKNRFSITDKEDIRIKKILVNQKRSDDSMLPDNCVFVYEKDDILNDPEINCVVELIGANETAQTILFEALRAGKHVVTGNKALIAKHMKALLEIIKSKHGLVGFYYEAAVCGGIPIVSNLKQGFVADRITGIAGIMNATSNFILGKMHEDGCSLSTALTWAQKSGFAEANPAADIDGSDAMHKLTILSNQAFGFMQDTAQVYCRGISDISDLDVLFAIKANYVIKLIAICELSSGEEQCVNMGVSPMLVSLSHSFARVEGERNIVAVQSENLGTTFYCGPGAGSLPSANSVAADIRNLASHLSCCKSQNTCAQASFPLPFRSDSTYPLDFNFSAKVYMQIWNLQWTTGVEASFERSHAEVEALIRSICSEVGFNLVDKVEFDNVLNTTDTIDEKTSSKAVAKMALFTIQRITLSKVMDGTEKLKIAAKSIGLGEVFISFLPIFDSSTYV